jgi:hypothetical protein
MLTLRAPTYKAISSTGQTTLDGQKMEEMKDVEELIQALRYEKVSDVRRAMALWKPFARSASRQWSR